MKKISKILGMIACAFVLMLSGVLLTACGGPYSVKGHTFKITSECFIVWSEGVTEEQKALALEEIEVPDEKTLTTMYSEMFEGNAYSTMTFEYKEDGTVTISLVEGDTPVSIEGYYLQTEDMTKVTNYHDEEYTDVIGDGAHGLEYINGNFCWSAMVDSDVLSIYFVCKQA